MDINALIDSDPERLGGAVCFVGTRVPIHNLFDYLAADQPLTDFLDVFPTVTLAQAEAVPRLASENLETRITIAPGEVREIGDWRKPSSS